MVCESRGEIVAMIPNREALLIAGSDDLHALKYMLKWAGEAMRQAALYFRDCPAA